MPLLGQELPTLPEHLSSPLVCIYLFIFFFHFYRFYILTTVFTVPVIVLSMFTILFCDCRVICGILGIVANCDSFFQTKLVSFGRWVVFSCHVWKKTKIALKKRHNIEWNLVLISFESVYCTVSLVLNK